MQRTLAQEHGRCARTAEALSPCAAGATPPGTSAALPVDSWPRNAYALCTPTCPTVLLTVARDQRERFYSHLYDFLYYEAEREVARDRHHITQAAAMQVLDDYMGWLAIVHQQQRGWDRP